MKFCNMGIDWSENRQAEAYQNSSLDSAKKNGGSPN
jgi:hypothetical protein